MIEVRQTPIFAKWLSGLKDSVAKARIAVRIDHGPGYRIYFARRGDVVVLLLCGGDKKSQARDIAAAKVLAAQWEQE